MSSTIDVSAHFSYRGETYKPTATLNLDTMMERGEEQLDFHRVLAQLNGVDTYSYLYEVMEATPLEFSNPTGLAIDFLHGTEFDLPQFSSRWHEQLQVTIVAEIARREVGVDDLDSKPKLKAALLAAYRAGRDSTSAKE